MRVMVLERPRTPLVERDLPLPAAGPGQVRIAVEACGVCRADLHIVDGELTEPKLPLVRCHQIAGDVAETGPGVTGIAAGDQVGVPWLGLPCRGLRVLRGRS